MKGFTLVLKQRHKKNGLFLIFTYHWIQDENISLDQIKLFYIQWLVITSIIMKIGNKQESGGDTFPHIIYAVRFCQIKCLSVTFYKQSDGVPLPVSW